jgi:hypothetical protein
VGEGLLVLSCNGPRKKINTNGPERMVNQAMMVIVDRIQLQYGIMYVVVGGRGELVMHLAHVRFRVLTHKAAY